MAAYASLAKQFGGDEPTTSEPTGSIGNTVLPEQARVIEVGRFQGVGATLEPPPTPVRQGGDAEAALSLLSLNTDQSQGKGQPPVAPVALDTAGTSNVSTKHAAKLELSDAQAAMRLRLSQGPSGPSQA